MLEYISASITKWLLKAGAISLGDKELYEYAVFNFFFTLIPLFWVVVFGLFCDMVVEGILLILPFMLIRKFSGGFHLKSQNACLVFSSMLLLGFLGLIRWVEVCEKHTLMTTFAILAVVGVILLSPIDSEERRLTPKEQRCFKKIAIVMAILFFAIYSVLAVNRLWTIAIPLGAGIVLPALLQLPCLVTRVLKAVRK